MEHVAGVPVLQRHGAEPEPAARRLPRPGERSEALDPEDVRGYVEHYGFQFPVAIDEDWRTLRRFWLDGHERREFTSVSFIIDRRGVIREVHKGGKYAPGDADYERIRGRIEALLGEPGG
jgi:hypothetical protein